MSRYLISETLTHWWNHNPRRLGASLSFYSIFSITPLLVIIFMVAGIVFSKELVEIRFFSQLAEFMGTETALFIKDLMSQTAYEKTGILIRILTILTLLFGSIGVLNELNTSLNEYWGNKLEHPKTNASLSAIVLFYTKKILFILSVIPLLGMLLLASVLFSIIISILPVSNEYQSIIPIANAINMIGSFMLVTVFFALLYRILPSNKLPWKDVFAGALVTSALFTIGRILLTVYFSYGISGSGYTTTGTLLTVLLWIYYCAQIFYIGASFTYIYSKRYGYFSKQELL